MKLKQDSESCFIYSKAISKNNNNGLGRCHSSGKLSSVPSSTTRQLTAVYNSISRSGALFKAPEWGTQTYMQTMHRHRISKLKKKQKKTRLINSSIRGLPKTFFRNVYSIFLTDCSKISLQTLYLFCIFLHKNILYTDSKLAVFVLSFSVERICRHISPLCFSNIKL